MNRALLIVVAFAALCTAALFFCTACWSTAFLLADLWRPDHAGVFMEGGQVVSAGLLSAPRGTEVFPSGTRFAALAIAVASSLLTLQAGGTLRAMAFRLQQANYASN